MLPTWANAHTFSKKIHVAGNTWSQVVTEASNLLQLAPRALLLIDLSFLDKMLLTWANTHIFCQKIDIVGNTWSQMVTEASKLLQLASRTLHCFCYTLAV